MLRKKNLIALLMAAMLSIGTIGVAFADSGDPARPDEGTGTATFIDRDAAH